MRDDSAESIVTQALARKYRPRSFEELVGQEHVVRALSHALAGQRLHHAYLFTGTRGVGKTTLARILARSLNCERGVSATPCGACGACSAIDAGRFVDLLEVDAASNTQVDKMRELLENALYAPTAGRYKVYVIDEVHQLSGHSFNAMLKTLEEPPEHVKFILATTDPQKVPVTVLSRCLQFNLRQIAPDEIAARLSTILEREAVPFEAPALAALARAARGSLRDALSLLDQAIAHGGGRVEEAAVGAMLGLVGRERMLRIARLVAEGDGPALIAEADDMAARGVIFEQALQELAALWHRVALAQLAPGSAVASDPDADAIAALAASFSPDEVQLHYQIALQGRTDITLAPDEYAGFTMTLLRMLAFAPETDGGDASASPTTRAPATGGHPVGRAGAVASRAAPEAVQGTDSPPAEQPRAGPAPAGRGPTVLGELDWNATVLAMALAGTARQLAQHCELAAIDGGVLELRVPEARRYLLEKGPQDRLRAALAEHLGREVQLRFTVGEPTGLTPAEVAAREQQAALESARSAIDADPFVRELVSDMGARVVDVKPESHGDPA